MAILVDLLEDAKEIKVKALAKSSDKGIEVGTPYLKDDVTLEILGSELGDKIRVAKFHAKANFRRVKGHRSKLTKVILKG